MEFQLVKVENKIFSEYYEGTGLGGKKVTCILDDYCVRYVVTVPSNNAIGQKIQCRREYKNSSKALCLRNATKALNEY